MERATIAIVGGGITGLSAAWELSRLGVSGVVVLEAAERPGGVIASERRDGFVMERGADSFLAVKPEAEQLCCELGLEAEIIPSLPGGARVLHWGKLEAIPAGWAMIAPRRLRPLLLSPLFSVAEKAAIGAHWRRAAPAGVDESVGEYLRRRFGGRGGRALAQRLAGPTLGGVYGGDVEELSVAAAAPRVRVTSASAAPKPHGTAFRSLRQGMGALVEALAGALPAGVVRLGVGVEAVTRDPGGYRLTLSHGETVQSDGVILAVPAWRAAELLRGMDPDLAEALQAIPYASSVNVNFAYSRTPRLPAGTGLLAPRGEGVHLLACTFAHQKFPGRAPVDGSLVRVFYGQEAAGWTDEEVFTCAREELHRILRIAQAPDLMILQRAPRAMPQYTVGHRARVAAIAAARERHPYLQFAGNAYAGVGVPDCIASGRRAAQALAGDNASREAGA